MPSYIAFLMSGYILVIICGIVIFLECVFLCHKIKNGKD